MQLTYRGAVYNANNSIINTVDAKFNATYRGQSYTCHRSIGLIASPQKKLVYRGVAYNTKLAQSSAVVNDQTLALI